MASFENEPFLKCCKCEELLDFKSRTLSCLHSFCNSCFKTRFPEQTGNSLCPKCQEPFQFDQLNFCKFLRKPLHHLYLQKKTDDWKCYLCSEDELESSAQICCHECQKLFCSNCNRIHKKLHEGHNCKELSSMEHEEIIRLMTLDLCSLHKKLQEFYCSQCNGCYCDFCYKSHFAESCSSSEPLNVKDQVEKQRSESNVLSTRIDGLEKILKDKNEDSKNYIQKLNSDCESKCNEIWKDMDEMMTNTKEKISEVCKEIMAVVTAEVKRQQEFINENEKILNQLEVWRQNLCHFLNEATQEGDVVCGLKMLERKSLLWLEKSAMTTEKYQLQVTIKDFFLKMAEELKSDEKIGSVGLFNEKTLEVEREVNLSGFDLTRVRSIFVSQEDNHIFMTDVDKESVVEFSETGVFVAECALPKADGIEKIVRPLEICEISKNVFAILDCQYGSSSALFKNQIFYLEREKTNPPSIKIKNCVELKSQGSHYFWSFGKTKENFYVVDKKLKINSFTKSWKKIKTLKYEEDETEFYFRPLIRINASNEKIWLLKTRLSSDLININFKNGEKNDFLQLEDRKEISDFCVKNDFFYFCNRKEIFSKSQTIYQFEKELEKDPIFQLFENKLFVFAQIDNQPKIIVFKINKN